MPFALTCLLNTNTLGVVYTNPSDYPSFISLALYGIIYAFIARRQFIIAASLFILQYVVYAIYVVFRGVPSPYSLALGIAKSPELGNLLALGLVAGSLSFGGAYTAIPLIQVEAVLKGAWLSQRVFLDCIAIGNALPAPLVIFATFVGFQGGLVTGGVGAAFAGAIVITIGILFPCFVFTIVGHELLEKLVRSRVGLIYSKILTVCSKADSSRLSCFQASSTDFAELLWASLELSLYSSFNRASNGQQVQTIPILLSS